MPVWAIPLGRTKRKLVTVVISADKRGSEKQEREETSCLVVFQVFFFLTYVCDCWLDGWEMDILDG